MANKISVCIIAKNEETSIENCLKSVIPVANEIIILDTGSTDKTKYICRGVFDTIINNHTPTPTIKIYETTWENDFSKARNECISYAKGDWILSIDADEILTEETQKNLRPFLQSKSFQNEPVVLSFRLIIPQSEKMYISSFRQALFRNSQGIHFIRPIHESLFKSDGNLIEYKCPFLSVYHHGAIKEKNSPERKNNYINVILKAIENNPDKNDNYYYFYHLGKSYSINEQHENALNAFYESYQLYKKSLLPKENAFFGNILIAVIRTLIFEHKNYEQAFLSIYELLEISPYLPDAIFFNAYCYQNIGKISESYDLYIKILSLIENDEYIINPLGIDSIGKSILFSLKIQLTRCASILNKKEECILYLNELLSEYPNNSIILLYLFKYYLLEENLPIALKYYFQNEKNCPEERKEKFLEISKNHNSNYKYLIKVLIKSIVNLPYWLSEEKLQLTNKIEEINV